MRRVVPHWDEDRLLLLANNWNKTSTLDMKELEASHKRVAERLKHRGDGSVQQLELTEASNNDTWHNEADLPLGELTKQKRIVKKQLIQVCVACVCDACACDACACDACACDACLCL
jgi:hypothetical protein